MFERMSDMKRQSGLEGPRKTNIPFDAFANFLFAGQ